MGSRHANKRHAVRTCAQYIAVRCRRIPRDYASLTQLSKQKGTRLKEETFDRLLFSCLLSYKCLVSAMRPAQLFHKCPKQEPNGLIPSGRATFYGSLPGLDLPCHYPNHSPPPQSHNQQNLHFWLLPRRLLSPPSLTATTMTSTSTLPPTLTSPSTPTNSTNAPPYSSPISSSPPPANDGDSFTCLLYTLLAPWAREGAGAGGDKHGVCGGGVPAVGPGEDPRGAGAHGGGGVGGAGRCDG
ncbi:hypothetical protein Fmac_031486 [Flemingia macrophylla]|uniref:Uncharacterized protein n=1 Tax=Flemingia macrophylla TaxID=520843 RepID=A0ABD1L266_9FABA